MTQFESGIKTIPYSVEQVYSKLSDLNNLESIKDKVPSDKISEFSFDEDSVSFNLSPVGNVSLKIIDRDVNKCIKFETITSPIPLNLWIQLLPMADNQCKLKMTVKMELNPFIKGMISKPVKEGLEKMADMIAMIKYD
jgi:hypothetical protein